MAVARRGRLIACMVGTVATAETLASAGLGGAFRGIDYSVSLLKESGLSEVRLEAPLLPGVMADLSRMERDGRFDKGIIGGLHGELGHPGYSPDLGFLDQIKMAVINNAIGDVETYVNGRPLIEMLMRSWQAKPVYFLVHETALRSYGEMERYMRIFGGLRDGRVSLRIECSHSKGSFDQMKRVVDKFWEAGISHADGVLDVSHRLVELGCRDLRSVRETGKYADQVIADLYDEHCGLVHCEFGRNVADALDPFALVRDRGGWFWQAVGVMNERRLPRVAELQGGMFGGRRKDELERLTRLWPALVDVGYLGAWQMAR